MIKKSNRGGREILRTYIHGNAISYTLLRPAHVKKFGEDFTSHQVACLGLGNYSGTTVGRAAEAAPAQYAPEHSTCRLLQSAAKPTAVSGRRSGFFIPECASDRVVRCPPTFQHIIQTTTLEM